MSNDLFRLTYASHSLLTGDPHQMETEVAHILEASRRNNPFASVTGALLFSIDGFAQTLEGGFNMIQGVFERIQQDPRHARAVVLEAGPIERREFADWSMAYAGCIEDERVRFNALTGNANLAACAAGAEAVLAVLRGVILRVAAPIA